jgi:hypothetical protein
MKRNPGLLAATAGTYLVGTWNCAHTVGTFSGTATRRTIQAYLYQSPTAEELVFALTRGDFGGVACSTRRVAKRFKVEKQDRRDVERDRLRKNQSAHDRNSKWLA